MQKMLEKIKSLDYQEILKQLNDLRILGLVIFGIVALLVTWSGIKAIQTNFGLQKDIATMTQENRVIELENENAKLKNEYYKTDQYAELVARGQLGLAAPGETVMIVPKSVALSYAPEMPQEIILDKNAHDEGKSFFRKNLDAWMEFFFGRDKQTI